MKENGQFTTERFCITFMNAKYLFCRGFLVEPIGIEPTTS